MGLGEDADEKDDGAWIWIDQVSARLGRGNPWTVSFSQSWERAFGY